MTEKTLTTENIKPALDALRGELAPWPVVAKKQDRLNTAQLNAANSGITSSLVAQIIANTAAIRALESAITGTGLRALVVATLPAVGTTGILYIVPVTTYDPETDADVVNYSNEYLWIVAPDAPVTEGYYEQVGQTGIVINNGQLTITVNGTSVGTFTANQSGDTTAAITVPTNADYVDRTTDQTVAGVKTFSSTIDGTASKAIADEDGTSIKTGYVNVAGNQTVSGDKSFTGSNAFNNILPNATNSYSLGSSSYQWSSVYAQTYYYNGTAWGLDKANTWTQNNRFTTDLTINSEAAANTQSALSSSKIRQIIFNDSSNSNYFFRLRQYVDATSSRMQFNAQGFDSNNQAYSTTFVYRANSAGNAELYPGDNNQSLGTSTNKWKFLNGVNPGALGIPDKNNMVNIASEFTDLTGGFNYYIPPADGFVSINADTDVYCAVVSSTHNTAFWRQSAVATSTGYASVTIPVRAGLHLQAKINSTVAIYAAFYPCLGNV